MKSLRIERLKRSALPLCIAKNLSMVALLIASATFVACSSSDDSIIEEPQQPAGTKTYTMTVQASKGGEGTRALSLSGSTLSAIWEENDEVTVYENDNCLGTLKAEDVSSDGSSCKLTGKLDQAPTGTELTLKYLSPSYSTQDGTLTGNATSIDKVCDYAEATVTATVLGSDITTTDASFTNQQAIVKFTLLKKADGSNLVIPASTALTVNDGTHDYTITPTSATNVLYVAIPATNTVSLSKVIDDFDYYYIKTGANLIAGNYYEITVKMSPKLAVKRAGQESYTKVTGNTTLNGGDLLTGVLFDNFKISIANDATVTLDNVTINGENSSSYGWAGITCNGNANIVLSGNNNIRGFYEFEPGIQPGGQGTTLTISGAGSLMVSSNGRAAGIGCNYASTKCGNITITGGTITAIGGKYGAGIGSASYNTCGDITITGGSITAIGGQDAAGIGTGEGGEGSEYENWGPDNDWETPEIIVENDIPSVCGTITISGGTVVATGGQNGAGIGTGKIGNCGDITITSEVTSVTATKGSGAQHSIGRGYDGGGFFASHALRNFSVTIGSNVGYISTNTYTYQP